MQNGGKPVRGIIKVERYAYVSPVFSMEPDFDLLVHMRTPALADAEFDLAALPVIRLNTMYLEGLLGPGTKEWDHPTYIRFIGLSGLAHFEVFAHDGEVGYHRYELDPWDRADKVRVDLDDAIHELDKIDIEHPNAPARALDLTLEVLRGWFPADLLSEADIAAWEGYWLAQELDARGAWTEGLPPWRF